MHASTLCSEEFTIQDNTIGWFRPKFHGKQKRYLQATMPNNELRVLKRCINTGLLPSAPWTLRRWVASVGERAGYTGICPLTLRHSRAIYLLDSGLALNRVASLLGCSWDVLERHYAQIEAARLVL